MYDHLCQHNLSAFYQKYYVHILKKQAVVTVLPAFMVRAILQKEVGCWSAAVEARGVESF